MIFILSSERPHTTKTATVCMGFGCNAVGVTGCRIIDSPRERLIAILTNTFVPCNGRFPTLIAVITMFFVSAGGGIVSALLLTLCITLGIALTFALSYFLSKTFLKGVPSSFALELPPYRKPQVGKVLVRAFLDRTLFILWRAVTVAAPAGLLIWCMANIAIGDSTILQICAGFLDAPARFIGLDGVILLAFIIGMPANEIVMPIIMMAYMASGTLMEYDLPAMRQLLIANGWTWVTAACVMLFSLAHWPCTTTLITIKKETKSRKWTILAFVLPTLCGLVLCAFLANIVRLFG